MKVVLINKSDLRGGAAVVTFRLTQALRAEGIDAKMLVEEKLSSEPWVVVAAPKWRCKLPFVAERMEIFTANHFNRADLFKADSGAFGLPLSWHPLVREADVVCLNWINQGMLSLDEIRKIGLHGKRIIWTMHDMWCATGICHHAGKCEGYLGRCGDCPLLGKGAGKQDLSWSVHNAKASVYKDAHITFVAVSNWLADKCRQSSLLAHQDLHVIPNAFPMPEVMPAPTSDKVRLIFGAARIDDPIKGFDVLIRALQILKKDHPAEADGLSLTTFGSIRDESLLAQIPIQHKHLGTISNQEAARQYADSHIVVSTSHYETLPGTLVEGMAGGCLPVAFRSGGQADIISDDSLGILVPYTSDPEADAHAMAEAIASAKAMIERRGEELRIAFRQSINKKFAAKIVANKYIKLINK